MKPGKAYKLAAEAAGHKVKATTLLSEGDHEGAKREEIAYLDRVEDIPSKFRHEAMRFLEAAIQVKRDAAGKQRQLVE